MFNVNGIPELLPMELVQKAKELSSSLISDAMFGLGVMDYKIKPVVSGMKIAGTAFTVNLRSGSNMLLRLAIAMAGHGYVLVVNSQGDTCKAVMGDMMASAAQKQEIEGVVLDGLVRDIAELRKLGLPLFAIGAVPAAVQREGPGEINGPVSCGGIAVNPGDLIVGDDDGVVVVPSQRISDVLQAAIAKKAAETEQMQGIDNFQENHPQRMLGDMMPRGTAKKSAGDIVKDVEHWGTQEKKLP